MKFRFFLILLLSLSTIGITLSVSFNYYLSAARIEIIDAQLRESAVALVNSEFADIKKIDFEAAQQLISEELGSSRIGKFFIIRNEKGEIVFKSGAVTLMDINPPKSPQMYTIVLKGHTLRVLNLNLPKRSDRTLQVGALIDPTLLDWHFVSNKLPIYVVMTMIPILIFSLILTNYLLKPLNVLATHLQVASEDLQNLRPAPELPKKLLKYTQHSTFNNDEFSLLVENTNQLLERINVNYKMTKPWTYQLAHEIKTPLSILNFDVEALGAENLKDQSLIKSMRGQIEKISNTVTQFLEWASVENTRQKDNLFALRITAIIENLIGHLERVYPERIKYVVKEDFTVISNPQHLHQLINNIVTNALHYSPANAQVTIETFDNIIKITDKGHGISKEVLERIGQPFNTGAKPDKPTHSHTGLGLAWINTITKLYDWDLNIQTSEEGTIVSIRFTQNLIT